MTLLSKNEYVKQGVFTNKHFDKDIEGQNFYLIENNINNVNADGTLGYIQI